MTSCCYSLWLSSARAVAISVNPEWRLFIIIHDYRLFVMLLLPVMVCKERMLLMVVSIWIIKHSLLPVLCYLIHLSLSAFTSLLSRKECFDCPFNISSTNWTFRMAGAQSVQHTIWPHGRNATVAFNSKHTLQSIWYLSCWFSSSKDSVSER